MVEANKVMTKEDIQTEYRQAAGSLGEMVYRMLTPFLEAGQIMSRMLWLNQEAWRLEQKEKITAAPIAKVEGV